MSATLPQAPAPFKPLHQRVDSAALARDPEIHLTALQTARDLIRWTVTRLTDAGCGFGHGTTEAFDEAIWLVFWCLRLPMDRIEPYLDSRVTAAERSNVLQLVERRCADKQPLAYLLGEAWLLGRRFVCDARALVPRSPIAGLLDAGLAPWIEDPSDIESVLDLCTGGGSLAIFAAQNFERAQVVGADLSDDALALAATNVGLFELNERITLLQGDLYDAVAGMQFDLIVCNPPYVNQRSMDALPAEFLAEPQGALAGGDDGMDLVRTIVELAPVHLSEQGLLLLEIGHEADHFEAAFPGLEINWLPIEVQNGEATGSGDRMIALLTYDALMAWRSR